MSIKSNKYKDIEKWREVRERHKRKYRLKTGSFKHKPRQYTIEELSLIEEHSIPDRELSKKINRSVQAIQVARSRIKNGRYTI